VRVGLFEHLAQVRAHCVHGDSEPIGSFTEIKSLEQQSHKGALACGQTVELSKQFRRWLGLALRIADEHGHGRSAPEDEVFGVLDAEWSDEDCQWTRHGGTRQSERAAGMEAAADTGLGGFADQAVQRRALSGNSGGKESAPRGQAVAVGQNRVRRRVGPQNPARGVEQENAVRQPDSTASGRPSCGRRGR
jgi:hypothetical protein